MRCRPPVRRLERQLPHEPRRPLQMEAKPKVVKYLILQVVLGRGDNRAASNFLTELFYVGSKAITVAPLLEYQGVFERL